MFIDHTRGPTIVDVLRTHHLILPLDVRIVESGKIEMVWQLLPLDEVVDPVFVPDIAFPAEVRYRLGVGVNRGEEDAEVGDVSAGDLSTQQEGSSCELIS